MEKRRWWRCTTLFLTLAERTETRTHNGFFIYQQIKEFCMKKRIFIVCMALVCAVVFAQKAQTSLQNGIQQFDQGNDDAAIEELTEAIKRDRKLAEAYAYRSWAHERNGNNEQALADANEAIRIKPKLAMGYFVRGRLQSDNDRAIADYTQAIKLDPKYVNAYYNRGTAYLKKKDYDRAIADYTQTIKLDPKHIGAYNNRSIAYSLKKDYDSAIADCDQAIQLDPNSASTYNNRGGAYRFKGDYARATADYNEALRLDPSFALAKKNLEDVQQLVEQAATAEAKRKAEEEANKYDPSKFAVLPSNFKPADYTSVDLFRAVSDSGNLQRASNKQEAIIGSAFLGGWGYVLEYKSDLTFVRQNGTDITFSSDDKAITQIMTIDQRSGLQAGQKVRVYYMITRSPLTTWDVVAIERR